jgi:hypothetical protein
MKNYATLSINFGKYTRTRVKSDLDDIKVDITYENSIIGNQNKNAFLSQFNGSSYSPTKSDNLYLVKGVNIPRVKIKNLTADYNIKSVRNIDKATHVVVSSQAIDRMFDYNWKYNVSTDLMKIWLSDFIKLPFFDEDSQYNCYELDKAKTLLEAFINTYEEDFVLINYWTNNNFFTDKSMMQDLGFYLKDLDGKILTSSSQSDNYKYDVVHYLKGEWEPNKEIIDHILNCNLPIIDQNEIISLLNGEDATEIDEDVYESVCEMFSSGDEDNHIVAMEIMANCNYSKSFLYLCLLFYKYGSLIEYKSEKRHVNFKALISYMDLSSNSLNIDINQIVSRLRSHKQLTKSNMDEVLKRLGTDVIRHGETDMIKIKTVTLKSEVLEELNMNYTYNFLEDFTPDEETEVPDSETPTIEDVQSIPADNVVEVDEDNYTYVPEGDYPDAVTGSIVDIDSQYYEVDHVTTMEGDNYLALSKVNMDTVEEVSEEEEKEMVAEAYQDDVEKGEYTEEVTPPLVYTKVDPFSNINKKEDSDEYFL